MRHITLPNEQMTNEVIIVKGIISDELINKLFSNKCLYCQDNKLKIFNKVIDKKLGIVQFKCQSCFRNIQVTLTRWKLWTDNIIIKMESKIPDIDSREKEILTMNCRFCNEKYKTIYTIENEFVTPHVIMCKKCKSKMVIQYQKLYYVPYRNLLDIAEKIIEKTPELIYVLCASAFEVYCKYAFEHHSKLTKSWIESRKLNFQDLNFTKKSFKDGFNIDIVKLDEKNWDEIPTIFKNRHDIIHNGGFNKDGHQIKCTNEDARKAIDRINQFVELIEKEFVKDFENRNGN